MVVAHVLGDFALQPDAVVSGKKNGSGRAFLQHGVAHFLLAYAAVLAFLPEALKTVRLHFLLVLLVTLHVLVDFLKERKLAVRRWQRTIFVGDQILHVAILFIVTCLWVGATPPWAVDGVALLAAHRGALLWVCVVYLVTIFAGGYAIRVLLPALQVTEGEPNREREMRLGMYIGWLERFLLLSAIVAGSPTAAGLIVATKSIVRFKKVERDDAFAEYFLLGTFLSLALALIGGLALRWLLFTRLDLE